MIQDILSPSSKKETRWLPKAITGLSNFIIMGLTLLRHSEPGEES